MATSKKMAQLQEQLTANAIDIAADFKIKLDFSHKSIKNIEEMLGDFHRHYKQTQDEEGLMGIALSFAAYIITVIERHSEPGTWRRNHKEWGKDSFPYEWMDGDIFPYGWCLKRIFDGKQDDVWFKYQALVLDELEKAKK